MNWRVPLSDLDYGDEEKKAVLDVLESRWLTMGAVTQEFEATFAKMTGAKHAIAVSNGTQALHLACLACGVGPGDEVIVPSLSFVATANAVLYCGAEVRFADIISPEDLTVDPASIEAAITPQTKAIIPMHYAGFPCKIDAVMAIAKEHGLAVIEDAAHAPGAYLDGRHLGTIGDVGCFSFFPNKNLPVGEGGMLTTNRDDLAEKLRLMRSHGMTSLTYDRYKGHAFSYDVVELGYNYRIDEIRSALGLCQLDKLTFNNAKRREKTLDYWEALADTALTLPFKETERGKPSHHIFPMVLPEEVDRNAFMINLRDAGVQSSIHYRPIHTFSYYVERYGEIHLPVTEDVASREVTLPLYPTMGEAGVEMVVEALRENL
jgi:dTDP-4-amino-4,6-dideoxygalactose transaminase